MLLLIFYRTGLLNINTPSVGRGIIVIYSKYYYFSCEHLPYIISLSLSLSQLAVCILIGIYNMCHLSIADWVRVKRRSMTWTRRSIRWKY